MSEVWVAAIGTAASVGLQAYAASQQGGGGYVAPVIKPRPIDLPSVQSEATKLSIQGYDLSNADLLQRMPGLVRGNQYAIEDAYKNLTGPLDPTVQNTFATEGAINALRATGGGNSLAGISAGSAGANEVSRTIATDVLAKQDSDRAYLDSLLAANPEPVIGITGGEAANLSAYNTQQQNEYNWQKYAQQLQKESQGGGGF